MAPRRNRPRNTNGFTAFDTSSALGPSCKHLNVIHCIVWPQSNQEEDWLIDWLGSYLERGVTRAGFDTGNRTSHDEAMPANPAIPLGANPLKLDILEPCLLKPFYVLFLLGEQHPHICKEAWQPECWIYGANQTRLPPKPQYPVCFSDSTLRLWPILNTESIHHTPFINILH